MDDANDNSEKTRTPEWMRGISIPAALMGIIAFFLPWFEVSCGPINISFSGYDIATTRAAEKINPHRTDAFFTNATQQIQGSLNKGSARRVPRRRGNARSTVTQPPKSNLQQSAAKDNQDVQPVVMLWCVPVACFMLSVLAVMGLPRAPTIVVSALASAYLAYVGIASQQEVSDPANTGAGLIQARWLFGFWASWCALLIPAVLALSKPRKHRNSLSSAASIGT